MNKIAREVKKLSTIKEPTVFAFFNGRYQTVPMRLTELNRRGDLVLKKVKK